MRTYPSFQADGKTLSPKIQRAIEHYFDCRDVAKAGILAGFEQGEFVDIWKRSEIKEEIERRERIEDEALAMVRAHARRLTADYLDEHLVTAVKVGAEKGDTKALELGYERLGMRRDDNFMTPAQSDTKERPRDFYKVLRHTVTTEVRELEGAAPAALPAPPSPPIIEGRKPTLEISMDIEDY